MSTTHIDFLSVFLPCAFLHKAILGDEDRRKLKVLLSASSGAILWSRSSRWAKDCRRSDMFSVTSWLQLSWLITSSLTCSSSWLPACSTDSSCPPITSSPKFSSSFTFHMTLIDCAGASSRLLGRSAADPSHVLHSWISSSSSVNRDAGIWMSNSVGSSVKSIATCRENMECIFTVDGFLLCLVAKYRKRPSPYERSAFFSRKVRAPIRGGVFLPVPPSTKNDKLPSDVDRRSTLLMAWSLKPFPKRNVGRSFFETAYWKPPLLTIWFSASIPTAFSVAPVSINAHVSLRS